jgi:hypothetical protein
MAPHNRKEGGGFARKHRTQEKFKAHSYGSGALDVGFKENPSNSYQLFCPLCCLKRIIV